MLNILEQEMGIIDKHEDRQVALTSTEVNFTHARAEGHDIRRFWQRHEYVQRIKQIQLEQIDLLSKFTALLEQYEPDSAGDKVMRL